MTVATEPSADTRMQRAVDYTEIAELQACYATLIDSRQWDQLDQVFTEDATFDATGSGYQEPMDGLEHIKRHMATIARHPAAHLILNLTVEIDDDRAAARSRLAALQSDGRLFTGEYRDELVRTDAGWRVRSRTYTRLQQPTDPTLQK